MSSPGPRATRVSEADRVLRCWKCKTERVLTAGEYARKQERRIPLTSPYDPCECGGFYALYRLQEREIVQPKPARDPLWADFQDASLRADGDRLADIGDRVLSGVPVEWFGLTANERIIVDAYCTARATDG